MVIAMENGDLNGNIDLIRNGLGKQSPMVVKHFYIGIDQPLEAAIIYVNGITNKDIIDRDILNPLMIHIQENLNGKAKYRRLSLQKIYFNEQYIGRIRFKCSD